MERQHDSFAGMIQIKFDRMISAQKLRHSLHLPSWPLVGCEQVGCRGMSSKWAPVTCVPLHITLIIGSLSVPTQHIVRTGLDLCTSNLELLIDVDDLRVFISLYCPSSVEQWKRPNTNELNSKHTITPRRYCVKIQYNDCFDVKIS